MSVRVDNGAPLRNKYCAKCIMENIAHNRKASMISAHADFTNCCPPAILHLRKCQRQPFDVSSSFKISWSKSRARKSRKQVIPEHDRKGHALGHAPVCQDKGLPKLMDAQSMSE